MHNKDPKFRRNNFDVTNTVNVTDPVAVGDALESIFLGLFPDADFSILRNVAIIRTMLPAIQAIMTCSTFWMSHWPARA
jgi:hypothetical protein